MGGHCKNICESLPRAMGNGCSYKNEKLVRCTTCAIFFEHEGLWCPCCSNRVRRRSRNCARKEKVYI